MSSISLSLLKKIKYRSTVLVNFLLVLYTVCCSGNLNSNTGQAAIVMQVSSNHIIGEQNNIEVSFDLSQNITRADLSRYQLKVSFIRGEVEICYSCAGRYSRIKAYRSKNLCDLAQKSTLGEEDEALVLMFDLIPAASTNTVNIDFELLDRAGNILQSHTVSWNKYTHMPTTHLQTGYSGKILAHVANNPSSLVEGASLIEENLLTSQDKSNIEQEYKGVKVGKRVRVVQPENFSKKAKVASIDSFKENQTTIEVHYNSMEISELAELANNNANAQEEIINRCFQISISPLMQNLIDPFKWRDIQEKAQQDERYTYLLLRFSKKDKDNPIYQTLVNSVQAHAQADNPLAQTNLGLMFRRGVGVEQNYNKAVEWLNKAANQNDVKAQKILGAMYFNGEGVACDYHKAIEWYTKSAMQGDAVAQNNLGYMYSEALGVTCNNDKALYWYMKSAHQGYACAQYNLAVMYKKGEGVSANYEEALKWFTKAAQQRHTGAQYNLGIIYRDGLGTSQDHKKALKWLTKAAKNNYAPAQINLGHMYYEGTSVRQDYHQAFDCCSRAAMQGDANAQLNLAIMYKNGHGTNKDLAQCTRWFLKAKSDLILTDIFKVNLFSPSVEISHDTEMDLLQATLLSNWQASLIQKERDRVSKHAIFHAEAYRKLEETIAQFITWRLQLNIQPKLMISCLLLRKGKYILTLQNYERSAGILPYIKQHVLLKGNYLSLGEKNVELANAIVDEFTEKVLYKQTKHMLNQMKESYNMAQMKAVSNATFMEESLQIPGLTLTEETELIKNLDRSNKLAAIFMQKVEVIEHQLEQFNRYYMLLLKEIEIGQYIRNQKFQEKYSFIFKHKSNYETLEDDSLSLD
jgi:TPR repeat protein